MSSDTTCLISNFKAHYVGIRDLSAEVLILIFRRLQGQDIARCMEVCRYFADLIRSEESLQYGIELAQNGMVDSDSSTLLVSERLQRLRQYSSDFCNGIFRHEDLDAHPDYSRQFRNLGWNARRRTDGSVTSAIGYNSVGSQALLSVFTHGSTQAGIESRRWMTPVGTDGDARRSIRDWAIDRAQDLLATLETIEMVMDGRMRRSHEIHFWSLSSSQATLTYHRAATIPCIQVFPPPNCDVACNPFICTFIIGGSHVIWQMGTAISRVDHYSIEVFNWRSGQMVSRLDFGTQEVEVVPWGDTHLLATPVESDTMSLHYLYIYSLSSSAPNHALLILELPEPKPELGETLMVYLMTTSIHHPTPRSHFCLDPARSMVLVTHSALTVEGESGVICDAFHLLIPYTTLRAQIAAASTVDSVDSESSGPPAPIPWEEWGPRTCLRLRLPLMLAYRIELTPLGSQMPVVRFDGLSGSGASVYVFDIDPLAAQHVRAARSQRDPGWESTAVVEDVDAALPGVVDPECAGIPYVVYRFTLPPSEYNILAVQMTLTGFVVRFHSTIGYKDTEESWTV